MFSAIRSSFTSGRLPFSMCQLSWNRCLLSWPSPVLFHQNWKVGFWRESFPNKNTWLPNFLCGRLKQIKLYSSAQSPVNQLPDESESVYNFQVYNLNQTCSRPWPNSETPRLSYLTNANFSPILFCFHPARHTFLLLLEKPHDSAPLKLLKPSDLPD